MTDLGKQLELEPRLCRQTYHGHHVEPTGRPDRGTSTVRQDTCEELTGFSKPPKPSNPPPPPLPPPQPREGYGSKNPSVHPTKTFGSGG